MEIDLKVKVVRERDNLFLCVTSTCGRTTSEEKNVGSGEVYNVGRGEFRITNAGSRFVHQRH